MKYECLKNTAIEEIYDTFIDAFSDYQVKIDMSFEKFQSMMIRRSVDFSSSMGVFDNGQLVGFILNGKRKISNKLIAYDSGTGVRRKYQGEKLGKQMLYANIEFLKANSFDKYLLEVITNNEKAFNLYKNFGFNVTRKFNCFKNNLMNFDETDTSTVYVEEIGILAIKRAELVDYFDFEPSWQNSIESVKEDFPNFTMFQAALNKQVVGYGIIEPKTGDIPFLSVKREFRKMFVGAAILKRLKEETTASSLSVLNIPSDCEYISSFLEKHNFKNFAQQYEMEYYF